MRRLLLAWALLLAASAQAEDAALKRFVPGSAKAIIEARAGRPFILTFWSVDCVHCRAELEQLAALSRAHPALEVVLVSTDGPEASREVSAALRPYRFARMESWVFADAFAERLRFEVDRRWRGELPRTYLYRPDGRAEAVTGAIAPQQLEAWLASAAGDRP